MNKIKSQNIGGYILAGGDSSRFGENKALFEIDGVSMVERMVKTLSPLVSMTKIITKKSEDFDGLGVNVLIDDLEVQTPLAGILRGLEDTDGWGLFLACDLPYVHEGIITRLLDSVVDKLENESISAIVSQTTDGKLQPLVACYHKSGIVSLEKAIKKNYSMKKWLSETKIQVVKFEERKPFLNINSKEDLKNL